MAQSRAETTWEINNYQSIPVENYKNQYGNMKGSARKYEDRKCYIQWNL